MVFFTSLPFMVKVPFWYQNNTISGNLQEYIKSKDDTNEL